MMIARYLLFIFVFVGLGLTVSVSDAFASESALCFLAGYEKPLDPVQSPDYQPGVDVQGNVVVPADVNGGNVNILPDIYRFPVTIDLAQSLALDLPAGTEMHLPIGMIEIYTDGQVLYNGRDITGRVTELCAPKTTLELGPDTIISTGAPVKLNNTQTQEQIIKEEKSTP